MLLSFWTKFSLNCSSSVQLCGYDSISYPLLSSPMFIAFKLKQTHQRLHLSQPQCLPLQCEGLPQSSTNCPKAPQTAPSAGRTRSAGPVAAIAMHTSHCHHRTTVLRIEEKKNAPVCPKTFSFENKATKQAAAQKGM